MPQPLRHLLTLSGVMLTVAIAASCDDQHGYVDYTDCDRIERRCRTVCDYWCDAWGCYPMCWDQCWDDCYRYPEPPPGTAPPRGDASSPPPASSDGGTPVSDGGSSMLCQACVSNDDCGGALCILRGGARPDASPEDAGGPPAGNGFCGQACSTGSDCPEGFACSSLGSTRQCLPRSGRCN